MEASGLVRDNNSDKPTPRRLVQFQFSGKRGRQTRPKLVELGAIKSAFLDPQSQVQVLA
jgi:hypothetical protein